MSKKLMVILSPVIGEDLAKDVILHRKGIKCPLTENGAKQLVREYLKTGNPVAAAEHHLNMGWRGFFAEWTKKKGSGFVDAANPMPTQETPEERNRRTYLENEMQWARNEGDTAKAAQIKALISQAVRH